MRRPLRLWLGLCVFAGLFLTTSPAFADSDNPDAELDGGSWAAPIIIIAIVCVLVVAGISAFVLHRRAAARFNSERARDGDGDGEPSEGGRGKAP